MMGPAAVSKVTNLEADVFTNQRSTFMHVLFQSFCLLLLFLSFLLRSLLLKSKVSLYFVLKVSLEMVEPGSPALLARSITSIAVVQTILASI